MKITFINQYISVLSYWGKIITIIKVCVCFLESLRFKAAAYSRILNFIHSSFPLLCFFPLEIDEDEEGDRITVRGDEELQAMINGVNYHDNGYIDWIIFKIDAKSNCDRWQKSDCQNSSILASIRV